MPAKSRCRSDSLQGRSIKNTLTSSGSSSSTHTQQQIPTIKLIADYKGKGKAVHDYGRCTPIADAFMSQRSSTSSEESDSTTKADLSHTLTTTSAPRPSRSTQIPSFLCPPTSPTTLAIPQNAYTPKPVRGYHFIVETGGYNSETSSMYTEVPVLYVPGASSPRRDNPKASGSNSFAQTFLHVPAPKKNPVFDVVAEYHGLKLCRVSDAVPYLLGTRNLLIRLASITEDDLSHTGKIHSGKISRDSPHAYSSLDLSLMAILHSLRDSPATRQRTGNWYPQGLAPRDDSLILYEHNASNGPEQTLVSSAKFMDMAQTWLLLRNPTNMSGDPPNAINSWIDIVTDLRKQGVDISKIDMKLYYELTAVLEGEGLERRISEIAQWNQTGHLDRRYAVWRKHVESQTKAAETQHTVTAASKSQKDGRTDGLYTKRFTHKYPLGRPKSLISEGEKAERRAEKAARAYSLAAAAAAAAATLKAQKKERAEKKSGVMGGVARRWGNRKKRNTVIFVLFIVLVLGPLVGALLWAMVVHKFDWTPGAGEGY